MDFIVEAEMCEHFHKMGVKMMEYSFVYDP